MLRLNNVTYKGKVGDALHNVTAKFDYGKFYMIIGAAGSGKATLTTLITGELPVTGGEIRLNNAGINYYDQKKLYQEIAVLRPKYNLFENLTPWENILDYQKRHNQGIDFSKIKKLFTLVNFTEEKIHTKVKFLTMRERLQCGMVKIFSCPTRLYLFCHPFRDIVDDELLEQFIELSNQVNLRHSCMIFLTDSYMILPKVDVVYGLNNGHLLYIRDVAKIEEQL